MITVLRAAGATGSLLFFGFWHVFYSAWTGYSLARPGWPQAVAGIPGLLLSLAAGLIAVASSRWIMGWRIRSWWLLVALIYPLIRFVMIGLSTTPSVLP